MLLRRVVRWRAALTLCLVAALLWAPIWGQWHGIAHQMQQAVTAPAQAAPLSDAQDDGHAIGSALCQVLDHLGHASALTAWPAPLKLALLPALAPVLPMQGALAAPPWWPAQARAPPVWM
ncbi:hypothetical protein B9Z51_12820 [Limnohabitans sp. T6-5]|uniref:hypothetical protein n=1 Tax=Limnohabitans sp. T6-5 TaxID=1100724 RepID=UPI000D3B24B8|nr:hypothetical protein [Limnohabitans sp. T6-5]PUE06812.1 hypothetical protein B9Z51_12820 [Limnohabitans sp. T6-5]